MDTNNCGITGGGLKCDNPSCDFVDMSITIEDYDNWVNKPCPKCGANLLTEEDYDAVKMMIVLAKLVQSSELDKDDMTMATARFNGTGKVEIEISKPKD